MYITIGVFLRKRAECDAWCSRRVWDHSTMLSSCSNSAQAQALMSEMQRVGVQPNLVTYNTLIQKHNRDGQAELAQQVLEEMIANGVAPDVVTYSSIIDGLTRNQKHRSAFCCLHAMPNQELTCRKLIPARQLG
eukprot:859654-Rhodomonas_salina.1